MAISDDSGAAPAFNRQLIENLIDSLLTVLDVMDGNPDDEPNDWDDEDNHDAEGFSDDAEYDDERNPLMPNHAWDGMLASYGGRLPPSLDYAAFNPPRRAVKPIVITGPDGNRYLVEGVR